jgi:hypothetical protein
MWIPYQTFLDFVMEGYEIIENIANFSDGIRFNGFVRMEISNTVTLGQGIRSSETRSAVFSLNQNGIYTAGATLGEQSQVRYTVGTGEHSYVYSFTVFQPADSDNFYSPVLLFPQPGISPLLNGGDSLDMTGVPQSERGTSYLITLYAKRALDIHSIIQNFVSARGTINKRLASSIGDGYTTSITLNENDAAFTAAPEDPRTVAALIVAINW